jgi:hypothetical protein
MLKLLYLTMPEAEDVMARDAGLLFCIWMLMSSMSGAPFYKSRARYILSAYEEDSLGQWSLPLIMGVGRG